MNFSDRIIQKTLAESVPLNANQAATLNPLEKLLPGAISSALAKTATSPLDLVKIILQTGDTDKGIFTILSDVYRERGFFGLWKGNGASILRIAPQNSLKYFILETVRESFGGLNIEPTLKNFLFGTISGGLAQFITYPLEVARTKMSISDEYVSVAQTLKKVVKEEGFTALYSGAGSAMIGVLPYHGGDLALKSLVSRLRGRPPTFSEKFFIDGALCGFLAQTLAHPFDVLRKKQQADPLKYNGLADAIVKTYREQGIKGYYKGLGPSMIKALPYHAINHFARSSVDAYLKERKAKRQAKNKKKEVIKKGKKFGLF